MDENLFRLTGTSITIQLLAILLICFRMVYNQIEISYKSCFVRLLIHALMFNCTYISMIIIALDIQYAPHKSWILISMLFSFLQRLSLINVEHRLLMISTFRTSMPHYFFIHSWNWWMKASLMLFPLFCSPAICSIGTAMK